MATRPRAFPPPVRLMVRNLERCFKNILTMNFVSGGALMACDRAPLSSSSVPGGLRRGCVTPGKQGRDSRQSAAAMVWSVTQVAQCWSSGAVPGSGDPGELVYIEQGE